MDEELIKVVLIASLETVGLMEVFKKFVKFNKTWLYTLLMLPLAFICALAYTYLPSVITAGILTVCVSQMFYKNVLQAFEGIVKKLNKE